MTKEFIVFPDGDRAHSQLTKMALVWKTTSSTMKR